MKDYTEQIVHCICGRVESTPANPTYCYDCSSFTHSTHVKRKKNE